MRSLRSRLAVVLLLCFVRVLLPDTWILALHAHEHTTQEPAQQLTGNRSRTKALLTVRHQHCSTDQFFKVPFHLAVPLELPLAARRFAASPVAGTLPGAPSHFDTACVRGPPGSVA